MFVIKNTIKSVLSSDFVTITCAIPGKIRDAFFRPKPLTAQQWLREMSAITPQTFHPDRMRSYLPKPEKYIQKTLDKIGSHNYDQSRVVRISAIQEKRKLK